MPPSFAAWVQRVQQSLKLQKQQLPCWSVAARNQVQDELKVIVAACMKQRV